MKKEPDVAETPEVPIGTPAVGAALDVISSLLSTSSFDLDRLLKEIARIATVQLKVKGCTVRLLDERTGEMVLKAMHGMSDEYLAKGPVIAARSVFREVIESCYGGTGYIESLDVSKDPRIQYSAEAIAEGIKSMLAVPLFHGQRFIGALVVYTDRPHRFEAYEISTLKAIASQAALAIYLAELHQEQMELKEISQELQVAASIQTKLMPRRPPVLANAEIAGANYPCREVGGDFFDFIEFVDNNLGIVVGDVSGKGTPAAILMANIRAYLRVQAEHVYEMREVMRRVNHALYRDTSSEEFATVFYGVLDEQSNTFTYVNAGHNAPILLRGDRHQGFHFGGPPVGIFSKATYTEEILHLQKGDLLAIYTDGYTDAIAHDGEMYGEDRFIETVRKYRDLPAESIVRSVDAEVREFIGQESVYADDRTLVVLKVVRDVN